MIIVDIFKYSLLFIIIYPALLLNSIEFLNCLIPLFGFIIANSCFIYAFSFLFEKEENGQKFYILIVLIFSQVLAYMGLGQYRNNYDDYRLGIAQLFPSSNLLVTLYDFWIVIFQKSNVNFSTELKNISEWKIIGNYFIY